MSKRCNKRRSFIIAGIIQKIFPGSGNGIKNVSFSLKQGSFNIITGKIGSGKTTLLRTLLGLLPKTSGEIYWNNMRIEDPAAFFITPVAAYVPQAPYLFSEAIKDNILLGLPATEEKIKQVLELSALESDIMQFEQKLDTFIGPRGMKLSGGQIQRTAAARMFARDAQLWVFDDISSALDVKTEKILWERVYEYSKKNSITCLVVTHKKFAMQYADRIFVLQDGEIKNEGSLDYLLNKEKNQEVVSIFHDEA